MRLSVMVMTHCFLAEAVGAEGRVYGFDVQADALNLTRQKLGEELLLRVTFTT